MAAKNLHLSSTQSNAVIVTLYEKCNNIVNPYFTWKLNQRSSNQEYFLTANDFSQDSEYYNMFTFSVGPGSATAGYFNGGPGEYHYYVYEKSLPYQLTVSDSDNLVEQGMLYVIGTSSTINSFTQSDNETVSYFRG